MRWSNLANVPIHFGECAIPFYRMRLSTLANVSRYSGIASIRVLTFGVDADSPAGVGGVDPGNIPRQVWGTGRTPEASIQAIFPGKCRVQFGRGRHRFRQSSLAAVGYSLDAEASIQAISHRQVCGTVWILGAAIQAIFPGRCGVQFGRGRRRCSFRAGVRYRSDSGGADPGNIPRQVWGTVWTQEASIQVIFPGRCGAQFGRGRQAIFPSGWVIQRVRTHGGAERARTCVLGRFAFPRVPNLGTRGCSNPRTLRDPHLYDRGVGYVFDFIYLFICASISQVG